MIDPFIYFIGCIVGILLSAPLPHRHKPLFWGIWGLVFLIVLAPASAAMLVFVCAQALLLSAIFLKKERSNPWRKYGPYLLLLNLFWVDFHKLMLGYFVDTIGVSFAIIRIFMTCKQLLSSRKDLRGEFAKWIGISGFYMPAIMVGPVFSGLDLRKQLEAGPDHIQESTSFLYRNIFLGLSLSIVFAYIFTKLSILSLSWDYGGALLNPVFLFLTLFVAFWGQSLIGEMSSKVSGYNIPQNFNAPWKAVGIKDFWQRWHMSMSGFIMQYIFLPLTLKKVNPKTATVAAFVFMGLWHNVGIGYFIWGVSHGILMAYWPAPPENPSKLRINSERAITIILVIILSYIANYAFIPGSGS